MAREDIGGPVHGRPDHAHDTAFTGKDPSADASAYNIYPDTGGVVDDNPSEKPTRFMAIRWTWARRAVMVGLILPCACLFFVVVWISGLLRCVRDAAVAFWDTLCEEARLCRRACRLALAAWRLGWSGHLHTDSDRAMREATKR